jgi:hypothetical protein
MHKTPPVKISCIRAQMPYAKKESAAKHLPRLQFVLAGHSGRVLDETAFWLRGRGCGF